MVDTTTNVDPASMAMLGFADFVSETVDFADSATKGIKLANKLHNFGCSIGVNKRAQRHTSDQQHLLRGLLLIATWGAFEASFDDYCIGVLRADPAVSDAESEYARLIRKTRREKAPIKFEKVLRPLQRDGEIPEGLLTALKSANQTRNIWAHNRGVADAEFVERASHLGHTVGERVIMGSRLYTRYAFAIGTYAVFLISRQLQAATGTERALPTSVMDKNPFRADYISVFGDVPVSSPPYDAMRLHQEN